MRNIINLNANWKFIREDAGLPAAYPADWTDVNLPHTWNAVDGNDGNGSYYRGTCWYGGKLGPDQPMWAMMQNFNLETLLGMMGSAPESAVKALNKQLIQFDLVD